MYLLPFVSSTATLIADLIDFKVIFSCSLKLFVLFAFNELNKISPFGFFDKLTNQHKVKKKFEYA